MRICTLFSIIWSLHRCSAENLALRSVRKITASGSPYATYVARSRLECATFCMSDATCDVCGHNDASETCDLYGWKDVYFLNPSFTGQDNSTVMIRRKLEIVHVRSLGDLADAVANCGTLGGEVATYSQLENAFTEDALHVTACGRVASGDMYHVLQYDVHEIGDRGIQPCFWENDADVYCTVPAA